MPPPHRYTTELPNTSPQQDPPHGGGLSRSGAAKQRRGYARPAGCPSTQAAGVALLALFVGALLPMLLSSPPPLPPPPLMMMPRPVFSEGESA